MKKIRSERSERLRQLAAERWYREQARREHRRRRLSASDDESPPPRVISTRNYLALCRQSLEGSPVIAHRRDTLSLKIPGVFSFIEKPDEALGLLKSLALIANRGRVRKIHLDHSDCFSIDLGASLAMDLLVVALKRNLFRTNSPLQVEGVYPRDESVRETLVASGILHHLGAAPPSATRLLFELFAGFRGTPRADLTTDSERASDKLTTYVTNCMRTRGFELTILAKSQLSQLVAEVLNNAETHSGWDRWWVLGDMDPSQEVGLCNLVLLNFGKSIYDTLAGPDVSPILRGELEALAAKHLPIFGPGWDRETLWTLYALQEGVSRKAGLEGDVARGIGTIKMIEFFHLLGGTASTAIRPRMCLISGSAYVLFDGKYQMASRRGAQGDRMVIAFNPENDLWKPPDPANVRRLKGYFPGTVISMQFFIDRKYLASLGSGR